MRYFNNFDALMKLIFSMMGGFGNTLLIFCFTLIFSLPLGLALALLRMSKRRLISAPISLYILVMRGTPLMLQIFAIYFAIPTLTGVNLDRMNATILSFSLNYAAYFAEIFRGGIQSIDRGQYEGAKVLGMTYVQTMRRIILPQVIKRVLPPVSNETINLLKDTSLVYILAMNDILRITRSIVQRDFDTTAFLVAAVFYLFFTFILTKVFGYLEKRYAVYDE